MIICIMKQLSIHSKRVNKWLKFLYLIYFMHVCYYQKQIKLYKTKFNFNILKLIIFSSNIKFKIKHLGCLPNLLMSYSNNSVNLFKMKL